MVLVDSMDFFTSIQALPPIGRFARKIKTDNYLSTDRNYDAFILGSSRVDRFDAKVADSLGYSCYNFFIFNSRMEDEYCIMRFLLDHNNIPIKHVILGLDPDMLHNTRDMDWRLLATPNLNRYLDEKDRAGIKDQTARIVQVYCRMGLRSLVYSLKGINKGKNSQMVVENGNLVTTPLPACTITQNLIESVKKEYMPMLAPFTALDSTRLSYLDRLIDLCAANNIRLSVFITPLHPELQAFLAEGTQFDSLQTSLIERMSHIQAKGYWFYDFSVPEKFGGRNEDFHDAAHIGSFNSRRILELVLEPTDTTAQQIP